jgi:hypothetical protein
MYCLLPLAMAAPPAPGPIPIPEVRKVLNAFVHAAEENAAKTQGKHHGDALTDYYMRRAAKAALAEKVSPRAYLMALGVAFDHTSLLRKNPIIGRVLAQIESDADRKHRLQVIGDPKLRNREDWVMHFAISAALTAYVGPETAEQLGITKEMWDARGTSGFSFADLAADYTGIELALAVLSPEAKSKERLQWLADHFEGEQFLPRIDDLEDGISMKRFTEKYGDIRDARFLKATAAIRERVRAAPGIKQLSHAD